MIFIKKQVKAVCAFIFQASPPEEEELQPFPNSCHCVFYKSVSLSTQCFFNAEHPPVLHKLKLSSMDDS